MARYFEHEESGLITVVEKELEALVSVFGLQMYNEYDEEWERFSYEGYAHFNEKGEFMGIVNIVLNQVNGNHWQQLSPDAKYRIEYDDTILSDKQAIEVMKRWEPDFEVRIEWDGSNFVVDTFISVDLEDPYTELDLNIDLQNPIDTKYDSVGIDYLYQDLETKKYYLGHISRYQNDLYEKLALLDFKTNNVQEAMNIFSQI